MPGWDATLRPQPVRDAPLTAPRSAASPPTDTRERLLVTGSFTVLTSIPARWTPEFLLERI
jgi:hypothetical protein